MSDKPTKELPTSQGRQPSPQAIEILAKMMVNKHKRLQREAESKQKDQPQPDPRDPGAE